MDFGRETSVKLPFFEPNFAFFDSFFAGKGQPKCEQRATQVRAKGMPFARRDSFFARTDYALCPHRS